MAEYSKPEISLLTETASTAPAVNAPSGSIVSDLAGLASTALNMQAQKDAKQQLRQQAILQQKEERDIAQGILGFRQLRNTLVEQRIPQAERATRIEEYLKGYDPEMRLAIVGGTNKLTQETGIEFQGRAEEKITEQQETEDRGFNFAVGILGISEQEANAATPEQFELWSRRQKRLEGLVQQKKAIMEVSDDITAPILEVQSAILHERVETKLQSINDAFRAGDVGSAEVLGAELRRELIESVELAPQRIRDAMEQEGKGAFYDPQLVSTYTDSIKDILSDQRVQDILSGKQADEEETLAATALLNAGMSTQLVKAIEGLKDSGASAEERTGYITDVKNAVEFFTGKGIQSLSLSKNQEGTLLRALGATEPEVGGNLGGDGNQGGGGETPSAFGLVNFLVDAAGTLVGFKKTEDVKAVQEVTQAYLNSKLDKGRELSSTDAQWIMDSLTFGQNKGTTAQGNNASTQLNAPLSILGREDYAQTVAPVIEQALQQGVDVEQGLVFALQNHIKNNFRNAFTKLAALGTSGQALSPETSVSVDRNRPSMAVVTGKGFYNTSDIIELSSQNGVLKFGYKAGTLGQMTDAVKIQKLRQYNYSLSVLNNFVSAMSNVSGADKEDVALEVMYLLGSEVNVPLADLGDSSNTDNQEDMGVDYAAQAESQGVDLSSFEDGEYEDGNGNTVVIQNGQIVSVN